MFVLDILKSIGADIAANIITGKVGDCFTFEYIKLKVCHAILVKQNLQLKWSPLVAVHQINKEGAIRVTPIKIDKTQKNYT